MHNKLFVYGTLSDPEFFELLLKRTPVYEEAKLKNYQLFGHPQNGYLFVKPNSSDHVNGQLVKVNLNELSILDLWEDVPLYKRELLNIQTKGGFTKAFVYTQNDSLGIPAKELITKDRKSILNDIREFTDWLEKHHKILTGTCNYYRFLNTL